MPGGVLSGWIGSVVGIGEALGGFRVEQVVRRMH